MANKKAPEKSSAENIWSSLIYGGLLYFCWTRNKNFFSLWFYAFKENPMQMLWNSLFLYFCLYSCVQLIFIPLIKILFIDTNKIGKKLEWYGDHYAHLTPQTKKIFVIRWCLVIALSLSYYCLRYFPISSLRRYSLSFSTLFSYQNAQAHQYFLFSQNFYVKSFFEIMTLICIVWILWNFEGRTRLFFRLLSWKKGRKVEDLPFEPLPSNPWDYRSKELSLCFFTVFCDENGELDSKETNFEKWVPLNLRALTGNMLIIGPIGSSKTTGGIKPSLIQLILWNAHRPDKKAGGAIYDPKAEMTSFVEETAKMAGREEDLIILSLEGKKTINAIYIAGIWEGHTSWKVASWIISAYQNFTGKSSPEPYWESQNYILMRNLLILQYFEKGSATTLYDLSKILSRSGAGCLHKSKNKKSVNDFGHYVLTIYYLVKGREFAEIDIQKYDFSENSIMVLTDEDKEQMKRKISNRKREKFYREDPQILDLLAERKTIEERLKIQGEPEELKQELAQNIHEVNMILNSLHEDEKRDEEDVGPMLREFFLHELESKLPKNETIPSEDKDKATLIIADACEWLLQAWSQNNDDNRGSIVSTLQPFLLQFETPEVKQTLSSQNPNVNFDDIIDDGYIFVPHFPGIHVGKKFSSGIITLLKARWQDSILNRKIHTRPKFQVMDEAQKIITFGHSDAEGDFEYMELSRAFGGITIMATQSLSALKAKAASSAQFDKIHGVVRSLITFATNDNLTIDYMKNVAGKTIKKRLSKTISENSQSPDLDIVFEKYKAKKESNSLSVAYTESEILEDKVQASDIQEADFCVASALIYDGKKTQLMRVSMRPHFWPDKHDKWQAIKKFQFDPDLRKAAPFTGVIDPVEKAIEELSYEKLHAN